MAFLILKNMASEYGLTDTRIPPWLHFLIMTMMVTSNVYC